MDDIVFIYKTNNGFKVNTLSDERDNDFQGEHSATVHASTFLQHLLNKLHETHVKSEKYRSQPMVNTDHDKIRAVFDFDIFEHRDIIKLLDLWEKQNDK